jgi:hypothetical protein
MKTLVLTPMQHPMVMYEVESSGQLGISHGGLFANVDLRIFQLGLHHRLVKRLTH